MCVCNLGHTIVVNVITQSTIKYSLINKLLKPTKPHIEKIWWSAMSKSNTCYVNSDLIKYVEKGLIFGYHVQICRNDAVYIFQELDI